MHLPRVFAAIFLFFVVMGGIIALIMAPGIRNRRAATPATVTATLPSGITVSSDDAVRQLTLSAQFEAATYNPNDRAVLITRLTNPTRQTIVARLADACTEPTLVADDLAPSYQVCAQSTTYVIFRPGQTLTQTQSLYLQSATADVLAMLPFDARALRLQTGVNTYTVTATWLSLHATADLHVSSSTGLTNRP